MPFSRAGIALCLIALASFHTPAYSQSAKKPAPSSRHSTGGTIYQVHYPKGTKPEELQLSVDFYLWIPDGVKQLRGVIVHQHGCGPGASRAGRTAADDLHWQALAKKWNCALMGSSYEPRKGLNCRLWCDARRGSADRFLQSLDHFADVAKHSELKTVPWCLWGHSGGGFWASLMQVKYPQRIVAIWLQSGTAFAAWSNGGIAATFIPKAAYRVPVVGCPGFKEKDHSRFKSAWNGLTAMQKAYREKGAFFELAPDPKTAHECGDSRYLAIPFFDFWLKHRLPESGEELHTLKPITEGRKHWDDSLAAKLKEFVKTGAVGDTTPPPAPNEVTARRDETGGVTITWKATADFESGIRCFIIKRDGKRIAQVPEKPKGRFGRPLFQTMSYSGTPEKPLPQMRFTDKTAPKGEIPVYSVRTVNSVKLKSKPTRNR